MNYIADRTILPLDPRNEGKIKSFESCRDLRAWSHDIGIRDIYLRQWIKSDMPICLLSTSTLARFMRIMACRSRGRGAGRCQPDCKSKVVLESICNSCHVIKSCLKNEECFEKYFNDEEFETSHWPCDRCLDALKSLKMFWKIIIEKIFNVTIPKENDQDKKQCCVSDSVRTVAKIWQSEMTQQAMFVKNISYLNRTPDFINPCMWEDNTVLNETAPCNTSNCEDHKSDGITKSLGKTEYKKINVIKSYKIKSTDTDCLSNPLVNRSNRTSSSNNRRRSRCSTTKAKMVDVGCECNIISEEMNSQKTLLRHLEEKCYCQKQEIDQLKRQNSSLRIELQNVYNKNTSWKSAFFTPSKCTNTSNYDSIATVPKLNECSADDSVNTNPVKSVESEMIITVKSGKNEDYSHISLLQVLHKTNNCPDMKDLNLGQCGSNKKEDPIELLTKVQHTFGAIVEREMGLAHEKCESKCNIDASFNTVNICKSDSSCSTTTLASNDSVFATF